MADNEQSVSDGQQEQSGIETDGQETKIQPEVTKETAGAGEASAKQVDGGPKKAVPDSVKKEKGDGWMQQRLSHYASETREAKRRLAELEARMNESNRAEVPASRRDPQAEPRPEDFEKYQDYIDAKVDWKVAQKEREFSERSRQQTTERSVAEQRKGFDQHIQNYVSQYEDPQAVYQAMFNDGLPITDIMGDAIMHLGKQGPEVLFHLSQHPQEAMRIAGHDPMQAAFEIAWLAKQLEAAQSNGQPDHVEPPAMGGRQPRTVPQIRGGSPDGMSGQPSDKDDTATWVQKESARLRGKFGKNYRFFMPKI